MPVYDLPGYCPHFHDLAIQARRLAPGVCTRYFCRWQGDTIKRMFGFTLMVHPTMTDIFTDRCLIQCVCHTVPGTRCKESGTLVRINAVAHKPIPRTPKILQVQTLGNVQKMPKVAALWRCLFDPGFQGCNRIQLNDIFQGIAK